MVAGTSVDAGRRALVGLGLGGLACGLVLPGPAAAHRLNAALSVVEVNRTRGSLDVTHRMYAHDIEHAFAEGRVNLDWFESPEGQAVLRAYCADRLSLAWGESGAVDLAFLGTEVAGDLVYVYRDSPLSALDPVEGPVDVTVWCGLLQDISRDQRNLVNLRHNGMTTTVGFAAGDGPRTVRLE